MKAGVAIVMMATLVMSGCSSVTRHDHVISYHDGSGPFAERHDIIIADHVVPVGLIDAKNCTLISHHASFDATYTDLRGSLWLDPAKPEVQIHLFLKDYRVTDRQYLRKPDGQATGAYEYLPFDFNGVYSYSP